MEIREFDKKQKGNFFTIILALMLYSCNPVHDTLFTQLDSEDSGIDFTNNLKPDDQLSIMTYPYFYNGGGVAAGDINNDGLVDLYFASNQGNDKLYLNQGNFVFKDISLQAGIDNGSEWHTGVNFVDINGDGWLDIYVCTVSNIAGLTGHNRLYINQGDGTFQEESVKYGLAYAGLSTHSAFFDFDKDGDLDCYLLNHAAHDAFSNYALTAKSIRNDSLGDRLYLNDGGFFRDVSAEMGIIKAYNGFGLGIAISDFNNDGWSDIYIANDFLEDDFLYLNQEGLGFVESLKEHFGHTSKFSMGVDAADINNDGFTDLITLDMRSPEESIIKTSTSEDPPQIYEFKLRHGYHLQYAHNCLQLNFGGERFSEIAYYSGVHSTDWSWSALFADFDLDGLKDLFISNGIPHRPNNFDFVNFLYDQHRADMQHQELKKIWDEALHLMPDGACHNYIFQGSADLIFKDRSSDWGFIEKDYSNGAVYADLDNDGDLDLITNRINNTAGLYRNNTRKGQYLKIRLKGDQLNTQGLGAKVFVWSNGKFQLQEQMNSRGFMSSVDPSLIFGLGHIDEDTNPSLVDSIVVIWPDGQHQMLQNITGNQTLLIQQLQGNLPKNKLQPIPLVRQSDLKIDYVHKENDVSDFIQKPLQPFDLARNGPALACGDVNGDGLEDLFVGGSAGQKGSLWLQTSNGTFEEEHQPVFVNDAYFEDTDAVFLDVDQDGDLDLYVGSGGNQVVELLTDRLYINDGTGRFSNGQRLLPIIQVNTACVRAADFDQDGDMDLFIGGRNINGQYGRAPRSFILINEDGRYEDQTQNICRELEEIGMVTDACWVDFNSDGNLDLIVVGEWMSPAFFQFDQNRLKKLPADKNNSGLWQSIISYDFDGDGDQDLLLGNLGLNSSLLPDHHADIRLYVIQNQAAVESVIAYKIESDYFPLNTRNELTKVFPHIAKKYNTYREFGGKSMEEIFTEDQIKQTTILTVNQLQSIYMENDGGTFTIHPLPSLAQISSINTFAITDINQDGHMDILAAGNKFNTGQAHGRYDAGHGWVLLGNGSDAFQIVPPHESGFWAVGEVSKLSMITVNQQEHILAARHDDTILTFLLPK